MKTNFLTKEGYEDLVQQLNEFETTKLPAVLERLSEAKAMGDLSENFEYKSALEDKDFIQSRINEIEELLENVEIIEEDKRKKGDVVDFGSKVTVKIEDDKEYDVIIVGSGEAKVNDASQLEISPESPLGVAVFGKKSGETVKMRLATGRKEVKIIKVK
ncbi:MAG: transcription elongation factor GreA [candidate division SR1 bacterium CG_4_9_14_3_um_filter_40_9]|nr:MAG: transcription elongation factor GreA [candidate division SR1 bacterium CG_4_9_14_3_um_filter_40_9]